MPKYLYRCSECRRVETIVRKIAERDAPAQLPCHPQTPAERIFSAMFQLITDRQVDRPENKYALGFSESERTRTMKADDAEYEHNWAGASAHKATTVEQAIERAPLNSYFPHV